MRVPGPALVLLTALLLSGCQSRPEEAAGSDTPAPDPVLSVLAGAVEPTALAAPTFQALGAVATGGAAYSAGEPSIRATLDGLLYIAFPGCDNGASILLPTLPGQEDCLDGVVYRSTDQSKSWTRLNREGDGRLSGDGPAANGDAEVAVDSAGTVYASNLGAGIQVQKSTDGGASWEYVANVVPEDETADRQWMAAAGPGHLAMAWMGSLEDEPRSVILNTTFDGGATWTGAVSIGSNIGWLGPVQFSLDGRMAYVVYTQPTGEGVNAVLYSQQTCEVRVGISNDGGATWADVGTGALIQTNLQGGHWSCVNMAPALDVTGDGHLALAWSEDVESPGDLTADGAVVKAVVGSADAQVWSAPFVLSTEPTAIMPWVAGGAGDRFAVTYFSSSLPADPDYVASVWDLRVVVVDGAGPDAKLVGALIDDDVHEGGICSRGGACLLTGSDRFLLDFFQNDVLPDGRLVVAYPANPASGARSLEIRFAIQDGGTLLLERP
ncbi:MAG: hypothetical protein QOC71_1945 [Thermoplasmata archaeon]|nr:hypothetical protein [Thermoplasmata archaeon]